MEFPFESVTDALLTILVVLLLVRGKRMVNYSINALGNALMKSINGGLGLDGIREDIEAIKTQMENVSYLKVQVGDLERQLEEILTDIE